MPKYLFLGELFDNQDDIEPFGEADDESSQDNSEFITINVTNETGESREIEHIKEKDGTGHPTHSHQAIGPSPSTSASSHMRFVFVVSVTLTNLTFTSSTEEAFRLPTTIRVAHHIKLRCQRMTMTIHAKTIRKSFAFSLRGSLS